MKKKTFTMTATLLLLIFASFLMLNQVRADSFTATWSGYRYRGYDSFYGANVVAYEAGSTAVLYVSVTHDYGAYSGMELNVSAVGIGLNWGATFNSTQTSKTNSVALKWGESRIFTITFTVPSTANVSNLFRWDYKIYMEHINATGNVYSPDIKTRANLNMYYFVVYSADQAKACHLADTVAGISTLSWNSTKAEILYEKAMNETSVAANYYMLGAFSSAVTHYETALNLINQAYTAQETAGTRWEDAQVMLVEAQVKYHEGWANFFNGLSNMWTLIGVALVLFAIGYIIRGLAALRTSQVPP